MTHRDDWKNSTYVQFNTCNSRQYSYLRHTGQDIIKEYKEMYLK